jgi:hypothetical protein
MTPEERTHRNSGADHAPIWEQASTIDGKACVTCREQADTRPAFAVGRIVQDGTAEFEITGTPAHADDDDLNVIEADLTLEESSGPDGSMTVATLHVGIPDIGVFGLELTKGDLKALQEALNVIINGAEFDETWPRGEERDLDTLGPEAEAWAQAKF